MDRLFELYPYMLRLTHLSAFVAQEEKIAQGDTAGAIVLAKEALTLIQGEVITARQQLVKTENDKIARALIIISLGYHRTAHNRNIARQRAIVELSNEAVGHASERLEELEKRFAVNSGKN